MRGALLLAAQEKILWGRLCLTITLLPPHISLRSAEERQPLAASEPTDEQDDEIHPIPSSSRLVPRTTEERGNEENLPPLSVRQTAELALAFCFLWFIANWSLNASLDYTTVASATILASTSGK